MDISKVNGPEGTGRVERTDKVVKQDKVTSDKLTSAIDRIEISNEAAMKSVTERVVSNPKFFQVFADILKDSKIGFPMGNDDKVNVKSLKEKLGEKEFDRLVQMIRNLVNSTT